jgi:hypothetical protein
MQTRYDVAGRRATATVDGIEALLILTIDDPSLWWPRGHGEATLYDLDVTVAGVGRLVPGLVAPPDRLPDRSASTPRTTRTP